MNRQQPLAQRGFPRICTGKTPYFLSVYIVFQADTISYVEDIA
ncbi:MAG: hypothetical protein ACKVOQ_03335 [Cyclobacteriaceae bacterium]|jgi:hypothetical protein